MSSGARQARSPRIRPPARRLGPRGAVAGLCVLVWLGSPGCQRTDPGQPPPAPAGVTAPGARPTAPGATHSEGGGAPQGGGRATPEAPLVFPLPVGLVSRMAVEPARTRPWRPATPVALTVRPLPERVHDIHVPVAGILGTPMAAVAWPAVGWRVVRGGVLATVVTRAPIPRALRSGQPHREGDADGARRLSLVSPMDGVLVKVQGHPGAQVSAHHLLAQVAETSTVKLVAPLSASERASLGEDFALWVPVDGQAALALGPADLVAAPAGAGSLELRVDNRQGGLSPGLALSGWLASGPTRTALVVPIDALVSGPETPAVFLQVGPLKLERRAVVAGERDGTHVEIVAGLRAGELVLITGLDAAQEALLAHRSAGSPAP